MYTPNQFKVEDTGEAHALMRAQPFGVLVTNGADGIVATHLPTVLKVDAANPLGQHRMPSGAAQSAMASFAPEADALLIFQGPEADIRPGLVPLKGRARQGRALDR